MLVASGVYLGRRGHSSVRGKRREALVEIEIEQRILLVKRGHQVHHQSTKAFRLRADLRQRLLGSLAAGFTPIWLMSSMNSCSLLAT